ncbi:MAG: hypothetical protein IJI01_00035 [Butyrivibrio sp.]|uniref:hypothetical protein n=1 Tax=Butyrivibrio sp. TaxID=28121 RepID=UPI0025C3C843|nr:hypothetical protein [Butyrivibrio sp.]MBQ6587047.1 hypothetical protein [Butyrivibrio sp.]
MRLHRRIEILRILNNILVVITLATVSLTAMQLRTVPAIVMVNVTLALFVLLSEVIQAFATNLIVFLGLHLASMALCSFITFSSSQKLIAGVLFAGVSITSVIQVLHILAMIIITIIAIYARLDGHGRFYPTIYEGFLFIGLYLFCLITSQKSAIVLVLIAEIIWGIMCIIYYNARQTIGALVTFKDRDFIPYDSIKRNNGQMLRLSLIIAFVMMALSAFIDYGKEVVAMLRAVITAVLRFLFSFLHFEEEAEFDAPQTTTGGGSGMLQIEQVEDNSIWHTIWQVLFWLVAIVVTIGIIYIAVLMVKEFYKLFNSSRKSIKDRLARDKIEYLSPLSASDNTFTKGSGRMKLRERLTPAGRVRQLFTRYIERSFAFRDVAGSDTPLEMEQKIVIEKEASAYKLYEKARYSSKEITSEDVKLMKDLCK